MDIYPHGNQRALPDVKGYELSVEKALRVTRYSGRGYTLLELSVCLFVAAILVVLIGNSIAIARKASMGAKNASNHRQIAAALIAYASDHSGNLPYAHERPDVSLPPFSGQTVTYVRRLTALGYTPNPAIFFSPQSGDWWQESGNITRLSTHKNNPWSYPNYGANRYGAMPYNWPENDPKLYPVNLARLSAEGVISKLMLLRDVYDGEVSQFGGGDLRSTRANMPSDERSYNGRVYASFTDGHVESFNREALIALETYSNSRTKDAGVAPIFYLKYTR